MLKITIKELSDVRAMLEVMRERVESDPWKPKNKKEEERKKGRLEGIDMVRAWLAKTEIERG